jgi:hypothetical protein
MLIRRRIHLTAWLAIFVALVALALVALAGCVPQPIDPASPIATPLAAGATPNQPTLEVPVPSSVPPPQTNVPAATQAPRPSTSALAVADLAEQLGIASDAITVRSVEAVEWNDASLGCAKPGQMYAQVIPPGYRIVLEANGQSYEYHTGGGRVMRCKV